MRKYNSCFFRFLKLFKHYGNNRKDYHIPSFYPLADYELDSFMPYEGAVYAGLLTGENLPQHRLTGRLRRFLEFLPSLSQENVPGDSLLREFIGEIAE